MNYIDRLREPHYVYRLYDADMRLLYVGLTYSMRQRMSGHRSQSPWFSDVAVIRATGYQNAIEAMVAEREAHEAEAPLHSLNPHNDLAHARAMLAVAS